MDYLWVPQNTKPCAGPTVGNYLAASYLGVFIPAFEAGNKMLNFQ